MKIGALYKRTTDSEHRQGARKALLIGINYDTQASRDPDSTATALLNCHRDIVAMRKLLIDCYSYKASDIVVMLDADNYLQPTHNNMILAMDDLVKGARPGDRLVFMCESPAVNLHGFFLNEADDFDEALMPMDHEGTRNKAKLIIDNAILDACHSGTLLDLDHYMCNMVYTPRISRGPRGSGSWRQAVQRKTATDVGGSEGPFYVDEELRRNPHPVLKDLVMRLMHARDNVSLRLHAAAKRQRKKGHDSSCVLDGVNFQDVQVGSQEKLDMEVIVFEF
ncbi:hypothetical protein EVJ58_g2982 [Rhodofomes roseus]|uniref:Peptidase C14 caspase domain-containing protein n=1 Tax=Rhodofomes roseus TaxID=34475 RepID=A0A4Y9YMQ7_9APHY|nr:hypothetical protein EVJ58_g2982 [Rhodofomes roseus]